jgi:hypothetical protein
MTGIALLADQTDTFMPMAMAIAMAIVLRWTAG